MHNLTLTTRNLEKARSNPLNAHCRTLLQEAGQPVYPATLGAPELMAWTLERPDLPLDETARLGLQDLVALIRDKPTMSLSLLDASKPFEDASDMDELLAETDPVNLGLKLLHKLKAQAEKLTPAPDDRDS